jgi:hypothetical protein
MYDTRPCVHTALEQRRQPSRRQIRCAFSALVQLSLLVFRWLLCSDYERGEEPGAPVVIDAPIWQHWRKAGLWVLLEGLLAGTCAWEQPQLGPLRDGMVASGDDCYAQTTECGYQSERAGCYSNVLAILDVAAGVWSVVC